MRLWRLPISDGQLDRPQGTALAWAEDADEARRTVERELFGESSYGKPFVVGDPVGYEGETPHVVVINWE
jgi:hypothetical protein